MSEVKRYWFYCSWDGGGPGEPEECDDGGYVLYEDYEELLSQVRDCNDQLIIEVYEYLQEKINPHIKWQNHGMSCCGKNSLTASVTESFEYLLEFWLKNRDKESVEHP